MLKKMDPRRAKTIDQHNPVRLIRALEINMTTGKPVPAASLTGQQKNSPGILIIGIKKNQPELYQLIDKRVDQRLKAGMVAEVKKLLKQGLTHKKLEAFGLEYRYISKYLRGELDKAQMTAQLKNAIHNFAKRQMTWFKRDSRIKWVNNDKAADKLIKKFLK
jgi:tRNA dimethylallyltransferase